MTWVKICGITNLEDAQVAVDAGTDALGFVFYEKSPRRVASDVAREIVSTLPQHIESVGVFVKNEALSPPDVGNVGLSAIQMTLAAARPERGPETAMGFANLGKPTKLFVSLSLAHLLEHRSKIEDLAEGFRHLLRRGPEEPRLPEGIFDTFFLDSGNAQQPGGTGKTFDWEKAIPLAEGMRDGGIRLVVAGGLTPDNVSEAMHILKPWGVDVSSGVEASPGKKDPEKVRAFIAAVRQADASK